jgi:hypothetical protein
LTFNTTSLPLRQALHAKRVLVRLPLRARLPVNEERHLLVTPHLDATLDGLPVRGQFPSIPAEKLIGIFAAGYRLTVTRRMPRKKERPELEQIVGADEVWALCVRTPPPGWRLLGRWYDKNVFIALRAWDKHRLAGHYEEASAEVIEDWTEEFGAQMPHRGNNLEDYLGGVLNELA